MPIQSQRARSGSNRTAPCYHALLGSGSAEHQAASADDGAVHDSAPVLSSTSLRSITGNQMHLQQIGCAFLAVQYRW